MKTSIDSHIADIQKLFPYRLTISPSELAKIRNRSVQTLARDRARGTGVRYKEDSKGSIEYPVREVAVWMHNIVMTV